MKGGGVSHGEAGTRDWALARESHLSRGKRLRDGLPTGAASTDWEDVHGR
jgi:hypothetical protein